MICHAQIIIFCVHITISEVQKLRILISGGGTAGHINPALAIADYAKKHSGAEILFVGTERGLEKTLVKRAGYDIKFIDVCGLIRKPTPKNIVVIAKYIKAIGVCKRIIKEFKPDVVVGTGGYVCAPAISAASAMGIPTIIHEQNVIPGVTVKMAAQKADCIAISFSDTVKYMKEGIRSKCELTGNPLDDAMLGVDAKAAREKLGLDERPFIVMIGGSLGAERLNNAMVDFVNSCDKDSIYFTSAAGKRYYDKVIEMVDEKKLGDNIKILPYIYNREEIYPAADLIISRAGALSVSEICALGKAAILIPSPNVAHNHQEYNARSVERGGGARVILESELTPELFKKTVEEIAFDKEKREKMGACAKEMGVCDASVRIFDIIKRLTKTKA